MSQLIELRKSAIGGAVAMLSGTAAQALLQIGVLAILARLVTPREFGVVNAALIVVSFANIFTQLGVGAALVQRGQLLAAHLSAALWLSVAIGVCFGAGIYVGSPMLQDLFAVDGFVPVMRGLVWVFPILALAIVPEALLQRHLRFRELAVTGVVSYGVGYGIVGVAMAFAGFGIWALVIAQLVQVALRTGWMWMLAPVRPGRPTLDATRDLLAYGSGHTLGTLANYGAEQGDNVIVTRFLGAEALGLYGRSFQFLVVPARMIGMVLDKTLFPVMSRIQHDRMQLGRLFLHLTLGVNLVTLPASVLMVLLAPELVRVLLGPGWEGVILPFQILAAGTVLRVSTKVTKSVMKATGAVYKGAWRMAVYAGLIVLGAWVGVRWGLGGVAVGVLAAMTLYHLLMTQLCLRLLHVRWKALWHTTWPVFIVAAGTLAMTWPLLYLLQWLNWPDVGVLLTVAVWGSAWSLFLSLPGIVALLAQLEMPTLQGRLQRTMHRLGLAWWYRSASRWEVSL